MSALVKIAKKKIVMPGTHKRARETDRSRRRGVELNAHVERDGRRNREDGHTRI